METSWQEAVDRYCDQLEDTVQDLAVALEQLKTAVMAADVSAIQARSDALQQAYEPLKDLTRQRETLLTDAPCSITPLRLLDALRQQRGDEARRLAKRCQDLGRSLQTVQQHATALFIAQYNLSQTTRDMLSLITTGSVALTTYGSRPAKPQGGALIDKAA